MSRWWRGTRLVFQRGLLENLRSKSFRLGTAVLLLISAAFVTLPQVLGQGTPTYTLATVGPAPQQVVTALRAAGNAGQFTVRFVSRSSAEQVQQTLRSGDATAGLAGDTLYVSAQGAGTFPVVVAQTLVSLETAQRLADAGLTPQQVAELQSVRPPAQVTVGRVQDEGRGAVGFAVGIVLYMALLMGGSAIATTVALEKSTRISEVLLAVLRPSQILVGTVLAVGTSTFLQILVLAAPVAVAAQVSDAVGLPSVAAGDIALAVVWFLLGFGLYAFVYAACGALVNKVTEVNSVTLPIVVALVSGYLVAILVVMDDPQSVWSVVASLFPLSAPLAMPLRWASGEVPVYQLLLAMALTAGAAAALVSVASSIYRRALLITGRRVRFREVVGTPDGH